MALSTRDEGIQGAREVYKRCLNSRFYISCLRILCIYIETLGLSATDNDLGKFENWAHANVMKGPSTRSYMWVKVIPGTNTDWLENRLRATLAEGRRSWGCCG